jgi:diaminopimelate epimerase
MRFEKWHGIGNAYLVIEERDVPADLELTAPRVERICDPDLGAGSDGILLIGAGDGRPRVRIFNPDGSEAEFSGNGTRIAAGYLMRRDALGAAEMETIKGVIRAERRGGDIAIDAGAAALESATDYVPNGGAPPADGYTFVSVGNPHCVVEVGDPRTVDLDAEGPALERHPWFPNRANVEFYRAVGDHELELRVWERGAGETLSSGSCATAAAVAAVTGGRVQSPVTVHMDGGDLSIDVDPDLNVRLTGPVERVLAGEFDRSYLESLEQL